MFNSYIIINLKLVTLSFAKITADIHKYRNNPLSPIFLNTKSVRTVSCLSSYQASRIAYGVDKQQPLTPARYIVLPFGIVYIRSVSVVATHPTPYPILREFDKKDEFQ